jgi:hypothetical protein
MKKGFIQTNVELPETGDKVELNSKNYIAILNDEQTMVAIGKKKYTMLEFYMNFKFENGVWHLSKNP